MNTDKIILILLWTVVEVWGGQCDTYFGTDVTTLDCKVEACPGDTIVGSFCDSLCFGDIWLDLENFDDDLEASGDDECDMCPYVSFIVPLSYECQTFTFIQGCYDDSCVGQLEVVVDSPPSSETLAPTLSPVPTNAPSATEGVTIFVDNLYDEGGADSNNCDPNNPPTGLCDLRSAGEFCQTYFLQGLYDTCRVMLPINATIYIDTSSQGMLYFYAPTSRSIELIGNNSTLQPYPGSDQTPPTTSIIMFRGYNGALVNVLVSGITVSGFDATNAVLYFYTVTSLIVTDFTCTHCTTSCVLASNTTEATITQSHFVDNEMVTVGRAIAITNLCHEISIINCTFDNNSSPSGSGAAVFVGEEVSSLTMSNIQFVNNFANSGGAVYISEFVDDIEFSNCQFINNSATQFGNILSSLSSMSR